MTSAKTKTKPKKPSPSSEWTPFARDFTKKPYSDDEKRVAHWLHERAGIGGGDDPIGFLIASHEMINEERRDLKRQIAALKLDNDRLYALSVNSQDTTERGERDLVEDQLDLAREFVNRGRAAQEAVNKITNQSSAESNNCEQDEGA